MPLATRGEKNIRTLAARVCYCATTFIRPGWPRRERERKGKNVERNKSPVHLLNIDSNPFEIGFEMRGNKSVNLNIQYISIYKFSRKFLSCVCRVMERKLYVLTF